MTLIAVTQKLDTGATPMKQVDVPLPVAIAASTTRTSLDVSGRVSSGRQYVVRKATITPSVAATGTVTVTPTAINATPTIRALAAAGTVITNTVGIATELTLYGPGVSGQTDYRLPGGEWVNSNLGLQPTDQVSATIVTSGASTWTSGAVHFELEEVAGYVESRVNA